MSHSFSRTRWVRFLAIPAVLVALALTGCTSKHGSATLVYVRFSHSIASGGTFKGCIEPGQHITTTNKIYGLPGPQNIRQDDWDTTNSKADHNDLNATTKDGVPVTVRMNLNFGMVDSCSQLAKYMETIGLTRDSYFINDAEYTPGWITAMNYYITGNVEQRMKNAISQYNVDQLWPQQKEWTAIRQSVIGEGDNTLLGQITRSTNGQEYYKVSDLVISDISPGSAYKANIADRQAAKTKAQTAQFNKQAQIAQARADAKVADAQAKVNLATIKGWPSVDAYLRYLVIQKGGNPFQPNGALITPGQ